MATQYSNKPIVTDGLVYALDFGNPKSYVSGSRSIDSLKYDNFTGSILTYGGANIPNLENGLLKMVAPTSTTGSTLYPNQTFSDLIPSGDFTLQLIVNNKSNVDMFMTQGPSGTRFISALSTTSTFFGWYINPLPYAQAGGPGGNYYSKSYPLQSRVQHLTYRYSSGSYDLFVNGVPVATSARYATTSTSTEDMTINGRGTAGTILGTLDLGNLYIYNRALTSDEIYSNYLIQAQRYGLPTTPKPYSIDENAYLFLSQSGITDPIITGSIDTFVRGLKVNNLWDKMIAIYPFVGTGSDGVNLTGSQSWNLKEPTTAFYKLAYNGAWEGSTSGSTPSGSNTYINTGVLPFEYYPFKSDSNQHISILSYDTPVSSSYLMGTGMTEDLAVSTLAGDYGTPAAAYSVRKVRTAYSGALMDVRRSLDNVTSSIGYVSNGDLDTGSLLDFVGTGPDDHGFVARWYDQSGNNRHATQTATGSQPLIVLSGSVISSGTKPSLYWKTNGFDNLIFTQINNIQTVFHTSQLVETGSDQSFLLGDTGIFEYHAGANSPQTWLNSQNTLAQIRDGSNFINGTSYNLTTKNRDLNRNLITLIHTAAVGTANQLTQDRTLGNPRSWRGYIQEITLYTSSQASNREPIEYNINNYYNIYPQTSSFATSSFTIKADSGSISASLNNRLTSGISTSGPLGLITVSRTGSNSLTIARNGVTSSFAVPASGALSTGIYLGAINNNGLALGNSPLNISFASVGTGLTGAETNTYFTLVGNLQNNLNRIDLTAADFIAAVGTLTLTQQNAINTLVKDLKRFSLWDKMKAIYPFVGETAAAHKYNLKDPRDLDIAYRLTFSGTWTHNISGSQPSNARANTYLTPTTELERDSVHMSFYSQTSTIGNGADWSADMTRFYFSPAIVGGNLYVTFNNGESNRGATPYPNSRGFLLGTRVNSSTVNFYYNNNRIGSYSQNLTSYSSTNTILLGGFIDGRYSTNRMYSFGTIGSSLTDIDVNNLYTAVQRFQTTLGRQV